jgi:peptidoglycan/xylan/chitin deacetylase (PgdA/CDA1 family)
MSLIPWKECLRAAYYGATLPARRRAARQRAVSQTEPVRILFYHRVADDYPNAWTITTCRFADHIHWLRARFDLVSLGEAQLRIASGKNAIPTACITFDDGYADNMHFAVPLLLDKAVPFTYFVSTNYVLSGESFPHDKVGTYPLTPNTPAQIRALSRAGVEIGGHTRSHVDLGGDLSVEQLVKEIAGGKQDLEKMIGQSVHYFAFPYGQHANMSSAAFRVAHEADFKGVCSAYGGYNWPGDAPFHLRRIHGDPEWFRFKNWMTVDPRKQRMQHDFVPGDWRAALDQSASQDKETRSQGDKDNSSTALASPCLPLSLSPWLDPTTAASTGTNS